jgi:glycosyltransferase involved in cell wall biosynthesis
MASPPAAPLIVQIVQKMHPGGIETMALDLQAAQGIGGAIVSLTGNRHDLVAAWAKLVPTADAIHGLEQEKLSHAQLQWRLLRLLRRLRADAVILHHIGPLVHGGIAARLAGVRRVVHIEHDAWHYRENPRHRQLATLCERIVRPARVAVSAEVAEGVRSFLPHARLTIIPPGIDTARFAPSDSAAARRRLGFAPSWRIIGTVGRLVPVKGQHFLIDALSALPPEAHVAIVGEGPERASLEAQARRNGVVDRVHFLGQRSDPESILPALDVFCLPSLNEGLPRAVLEAQACGIPVVASDVGALREAVAATGRVVPARDAGALAQAIAGILDNHPGIETTRGYVVERFSLRATVAALLPLVTSPR